MNKVITQLDARNNLIANEHGVQYLKNKVRASMVFNT